MAEMAKTMGVTPDQMAQSLKTQVDAMAAGPGTTGTGENVSILKQTLPQQYTEPQVRAQLEMVGGKLTSFDSTHDSPLGKSTTAYYTLTTNGMTLHGGQIYVGPSSDVSVVTFTTASAERTKALTDQALRTVAKS